MFLSDEDLTRRGMNQAKLVAWLKYLDSIITTGEAPDFVLKGACMLPVRTRRNVVSSGKKITPAASAVMHSFIGGEKLMLTSLTASRDPLRHGYRLAVGLKPLANDLKLVAAFSGMNLNVDDAMMHLEGFENWLTESQAGYHDAVAAELEEKRKAADDARVNAERPPIITEEEFEKSDTYGAW